MLDHFLPRFKVSYRGSFIITTAVGLVNVLLLGIRGRSFLINKYSSNLMKLTIQLTLARTPLISLPGLSDPSPSSDRGRFLSHLECLRYVMISLAMVQRSTRLVATSVESEGNGPGRKRPRNAFIEIASNVEVVEVRW